MAELLGFIRSAAILNWFVRLVLFSSSALQIVSANAMTGQTFYKSKFNRCLNVPYNLAYSAITTGGACLTKCFQNPWCATAQYYPQNSTCWLYQQINNAQYWNYSTSGNCQVYYSKCTGTPERSFNYTSLYLMSGGTWSAMNTACLNNRMILAQVANDQTYNVYMSYVAYYGAYWLGATRASGSDPVKWLIDGTPIQYLSGNANAYQSAGYSTTVQNCAAWQYYGQPSGIYMYDCSLGYLALCQCTEWGFQ